MLQPQNHWNPYKELGKYSVNWCLQWKLHLEK